VLGTNRARGAYAESVNRHRSYAVACSLLILAVALTAIIYFRRPIFLVYRLSRIIPNEERRILYHVDHNALAVELRRFAAEQRWNSPNKSKPADFFYGDDPKLPDSLRQFRPGWIQINDDRIDFGCGSLCGTNHSVSASRSGERVSRDTARRS